MDPLEARFTEVIRSSARLVRSAIVRTGGRIAERQLEDLEQEVYLALWHRFRSSAGPPEEIAPAYLYRASVRETVRAMARLPMECELDPAAEPSETRADPERRATSRELGERIALALQGLSPDRRRAAAAHLQGFDVAEIMNLFGWSYERARNLIARGVGDLRRRLGSESEYERH